MCESCRRRPADGLVIVDGREFFICQTCDLSALERERRPVVRNPDSPRVCAARRRVLTTIQRNWTP